MGQQTWTAASQAAMLALAALPGDDCIRTDLPGMFTLMAAPASSLANWQQITGQNAPGQPLLSAGLLSGLPATGTGSKALYFATDDNGGTLYLDNTNGGAYTKVAPGAQAYPRGRIGGMKSTSSIAA